MRHGRPEALLAIDIGNTNVTFGWFKGARLRRRWRLPTETGLAAAGGCARALARIVRDCRRGGAGRIDVVMGSVVPALSPVFRKALGRMGLRVLEITPRSPLGMRIRVDIPSQVGADRLLNALAVHDLYGGPAVVVDFGTATTFDCVSKSGDYLGGAILPGPLLAAKALALHTAKLPEVRVAKPRRVVGKNTVECIQAGLYHGYLGMIERVLRGTVSEMAGPSSGRHRIRLVATGGLVRLFLPDLPKAFQWVPDLTLQGLRVAFERRRK